MKTKIINILYHPPPYQYLKTAKRFKYTFKNEKGQWLGTSAQEWPDLLGNEILKITDEFDYEVWQPDLRADRIYSHRFENGLIHKLFPAEKHKQRWGFKYNSIISSKGILENIEKENLKNSIIHLNNPANFLNNEILYYFPNYCKLLQYHNPLKTPFLRLKKLRKNFLSYFDLCKMEAYWKKNKKIAFVYNNSRNIHNLARYNPIIIKRIFMGCDFDFWKFERKDKKKFGVDENQKVILFGSLLHPRKQIDKFIEVISKSIFDKYNFKVIIAGSGEMHYESQLAKKAKKLVSSRKLIFVGYKQSQELLELYNVADLFASVATYEGGPVAAMKAIACNKPIICSRVGGVDDILAKYGAGILVDAFNYKQWENELIEFFEGKKVDILKREIAKEYFHWPNIAKEFIEVYKNLENVL